MNVKFKVYQIKDYRVYIPQINLSEVHILQNVFDWPYMALDGDINMYKALMVTSKIMINDPKAIIYLECRNNESLDRTIYDDIINHEFDMVLYKINHMQLKRSEWKVIKRSLKYTKSYIKSVKFTNRFLDFCKKSMDKYKNSKYYHMDKEYFGFSDIPKYNMYEEEHIIFIEGSLEFFIHGFIEAYEFISSENREHYFLQYGYSLWCYAFGFEAGYITNKLIEERNKRNKI